MNKRTFLSLCLGSVAAARGQDLLNRQDATVPAQVDMIYTRGLQFLADRQNEQGFWNDNAGGEPGVVGLAIAAFLAHGEEPNHGPYSEVIRRGLDYVLSKQSAANGYIGTTMYNHAFATKALAECYGVVDHPKIAHALSKAVELILSAQKRNKSGGWRYNPESVDADTTVTGSQLVSLFAARNAGLGVPDAAIKKGLAYLASCRGSDGSYGYTNSAGGKPTLTAIGLLCLALAKDTESKGFQASLGYLKKNLDYRDRYYPYYYEYYMSQALFHADEEVWGEWNSRNIRYLGTIQAADGAFPGNQGAAFSTAGALLSLALNYRYLPIYEK